MNSLATVSDFDGLPCTFNWTHSDFEPPTPIEIDAVQKLLNYNTRQVGKLTGVTYGPKGCEALRTWKLSATDAQQKNILYSNWRLMLIAAGIVTRKDLLKEVADPNPSACSNKRT